MPSDVYFINLKATEAESAMPTKISKLIDAAHLTDFINAKDLIAIKAHFGEKGNTTFIPPWHFRPLIEKIRAKGATPFVTDTNTLYIGTRKNAARHLVQAIEHGFVYEVLGAPVIIADGLRGNNYAAIKINKKQFKTVKIARDIVDADGMIVVSHFKGHINTGFGGAIKNLAMGCAPAAGKIEQHSARPQTDPAKCTGCGTCTQVCPQDAITLIDGKASVDSKLCIGCGECISHCPSKAMELNWETELPPFMERLVEYAFGAIANKKGKVGFINFVINVTPDCDCLGWSDRVLVPDVGILASTDPVAIDKASYDLVNQQIGFQNSILKKSHAPGQDKFKGFNDKLCGEIQFSYGEKIGLGHAEYNLIEIQTEKKTE